MHALLIPKSSCYQTSKNYITIFDFLFSDLQISFLNFIPFYLFYTVRVIGFRSLTVVVCVIERGLE